MWVETEQSKLSTKTQANVGDAAAIQNVEENATTLVAKLTELTIDAAWIKTSAEYAAKVKAKVI